MKKILFICSGNTCRSCMAEGIMKKLIKDAEDEDAVPRREYKVFSRGLFAVDGDKASDNSIEVMEDLFDIDISDHRAAQVIEKDVLDSWLILTMTEEHKHIVLVNWPEAKEKTYTLREYADMNANSDDAPDLFEVPRFDIIDPYGEDVEEYEECANEINEAVKKVVDKLIKITD